MRDDGDGYLEKKVAELKKPRIAKFSCLTKEGISTDEITSAYEMFSDPGGRFLAENECA